MYLTHSFVYTVQYLPLHATTDQCTRALGAWCTTYTCACTVEFFPQLSKKSVFLKLVKTLMSIGSARDNLNMHITGIPDM